MLILDTTVLTALTIGEDARMTSQVTRRWLEIAEGGDVSALDDLLAEDAVFYSPAVFTPQRGRALTGAYLKAAVVLFKGSDFRYVGQWHGEDSAVLEFTAEIDGIHVNGVDMIAWNADGKIVSFKVMLRPFKALQTVIPRMAELLSSGVTNDSGR